MDKKKGYVDSFVAYIDILGFREFVNNNKFELVEELFNDLHLCFNILLKSDGKFIKQEMLDTVTTNIISDSIIISVPKTTELSLEILIRIVNNIVFNILWKYKLLCRGAITEGDFYAKKNIAYGPAFVKAYKLESESAIYPRIIFTYDVFDSYKKICNKIGCKIDSIYSLATFNHEESLFIADYITTNLFDHIYIVYNETFKDKNNNKNSIYSQKNIACYIFNSIKEYIESQLSTLTDLHIREKYLYFRKYYNDVLLEAKKSDTLTFKCDFIFGGDYHNKLGEYKYKEFLENEKYKNYAIKSGK